MSDARSRWLLLLVTALVFAQAVSGEFVWDDKVLIVENRYTGDLANLPRFFQEHLWSGSPEPNPTAYYRPLFLVSVALDRALFGLSAAAHRLHSLAWHLAATAALWSLLRALRADALAALAAASVFALHPAQAEVVGFIAARNDAMAAAGLLAALSWLQPGPDDAPPSTARLIGASGAALFSLLCKESAALAPLLLLALDLAIRGRPWGWRRYGALGAALGIWAALRARAALAELAPAFDLSALPTALGWYARILLWPTGLVPTQTLDGAPGGALALFGLGLLIAATVAAGGRLAAGGWALAGLTWAPAFGGVVLTGGLAQRYAYLPAAGAALALHAALAGRLRSPLAAALPPLAMAALLSLHLPVWRSDEALWQNGWTRTGTPHAACGLFRTYDLAGRYAEAEPLLQASLGPPAASYCCYSASLWYAQRGAFERALSSGERALAGGCAPSPELIAPMSVAMALAGDWDAAESAAASLARDPTGYTPLVLSAAALRRGDESVLEGWEAKGAPEGAPPLRSQVDWLLAQSP